MLSPGAIIQREIMIGVPLMSSKAIRGDAAINNGEHTLQLSVSTWYKSRSLGTKAASAVATKRTALDRSRGIRAGSIYSSET